MLDMIENIDRENRVERGLAGQILQNAGARLDLISQQVRREQIGNLGRQLRVGFQAQPFFLLRANKERDV